MTSPTWASSRCAGAGRRSGSGHSRLRRLSAHVNPSLDSAIERAYARRVKLFTQDTKADALGRAPLFEHLSRKELVQLARVSEDLEVPAGEVLCKEGDVGHEFFVIIDGEVEVTKDGKPLPVRGGREFFGE